MDINFWLFLGSRFLASVPHPEITGPLWLIGVGLFLSAYGIIRRIHDLGRFDHPLWDRIHSLVEQNRLRDASALCEIEEGVFARMYKAGIDAARFSRQDSGDHMTLQAREGMARLRRGLGMTAAIGAAALATGGAMSISRVIESVSSAPRLDVLLTTADYWSLPTLVALTVTGPAAVLMAYAVLRSVRINFRMSTYRLRLLVALFERAPQPAPIRPAFPIVDPAPIAELPKAPEPAPRSAKVPAFASRTGLIVEETDVWANVSRRS